MTKKTGNEGLTLIELMVATALLAFGAVAGLTLLIQAHSANNFSRAKTSAINAAEQQLEAIFLWNPATVFTTFNGVEFPVAGLTRPGGVDAGLITVSANQPHDVTVSVVWQGQGTLKAGQVTLNALRCEAQR